jgi:hypothetical protein
MEAKKMQKGIVTPIITAIVLIIVAVSAVAVYNWATTATKTEQLQQQSIISQITGTSGTTTQPTGGYISTDGVSAVLGSPGCKYSYKNAKPYVNFHSEDKTGTATSPTYYFYDVNPTTLSNGDYWGDERSWTDSSGTYWTSGTATSGKLQKQLDTGKKLWIHGSVSGYQDLFFEYTVPTCGDQLVDAVQDTNSGIEAGTRRTIQYDTTAWTSSAIDLGVTANQTNYEYRKDTSYVTAKNKKICLSQIYMNLTTGTPQSTGFGVHRAELDIGGQEILVYDYDKGLDYTVYRNSGTLTLQVFDSNLYPAYKNKLKSICFNADDSASLQTRYWLDSTDAVTLSATGYCYNGNVTGKIYVYDTEGNALISGQSITC